MEDDDKIPHVDPLLDFQRARYPNPGDSVFRLAFLVSGVLSHLDIRHAARDTRG